MSRCISCYKYTDELRGVCPICLTYETLDRIKEQLVLLNLGGTQKTFPESLIDGVGFPVTRNLLEACFIDREGSYDYINISNVHRDPVRSDVIVARVDYGWENDDGEQCAERYRSYSFEISRLSQFLPRRDTKCTNA